MWRGLLSRNQITNLRRGDSVKGMCCGKKLATAPSVCEALLISAQAVNLQKLLSRARRKLTRSSLLTPALPRR